jgi:hypothetical protein
MATPDRAGPGHRQDSGQHTGEGQAMIQWKDIRMDKTISTKALLSAVVKVIKGETAFIIIRGRWGVDLCYEFVKQKSRWRCVGLGRPDHGFVPEEIRRKSS